MNVWHDVPVGKRQPEVVNAIIEIPKGSRAKFEVDKETGLIKLDRVLYCSSEYPVNYGFIPQSLGDDKDPLDILVYCSQALPAGCLVEARVIGVYNMVDNGEGDEKILAIATKDPLVNHIEKLEDFPPHLLKEIQNFFETYKILEKKSVQINGLDAKEKACQVITKALEDYKKEFSK